MKNILKYIRKVLRNPNHLVSTYQFYFSPSTLISKRLETPLKKLHHIAAFTPHNSGDALQTILVRDILKHHDLNADWNLKHVHMEVDDADVQNFNSKDAMIIGSGGLILPAFEKVSGWQWNCKIADLHKINTPLIGFALGYNLFRGHKIANKLFLNHINTTLSKSIFWGMRNRGSVNSLKEIVNDSNKEKIVFQPCITTIISDIYPHLVKKVQKKNVIALNCAFDREEMRFGDRKDEILNNIALAMKELSKDYEIHYFANAKSDEIMLTYLEANHVNYKPIKLYDVSAKKIITHYSYPKLVLGMRGHAQLIPFGCNTPILSLISHNKLRWFLDDIDAVEWGVEVKGDKLKETIVKKSKTIIESKATVKKITEEKEKLYALTKTNVEFIIEQLS
jgi:hypothetical protein